MYTDFMLRYSYGLRRRPRLTQCMARSLKYRNVDLGVSSWIGGHQRRPVLTSFNYISRLNFRVFKLWGLPRLNGEYIGGRVYVRLSISTPYTSVLHVYNATMGCRHINNVTKHKSSSHSDMPVRHRFYSRLPV